MEEARKVLARAPALEPDFTLADGRRVLLTAAPTFEGLLAMTDDVKNRVEAYLDEFGA
jgi:hypothetical protein